MIGLFQMAYLAELVLWVPLAFIATLQASVRRRVMLPLVASAIAATYEAYMSLVWSHTVSNPIRVDIVLVMFALGTVDALAGLGLVLGASGRPDRKPRMVAGTLCLGVPALAMAGFIGLRQGLAGVDRNLDLARRFRFEAHFRDDETEKRTFGELNSDKHPWVGYYVGMGKDDRFAHLIINSDGGFWIYSSELYVRKGVGGLAPTGEFEGAGEGRMDARLRMSLRRSDSGPFLLEVHDGLIPDSARVAVPMKKADPPRFPRPASAQDEVRFAGVFSATYDETKNGFWLAQVWLWESDGEWWGRYLHDYYTRGAVREFISTEEIHPACSEACKVLSFTASRGAVTLTRVSADEIMAVMRGRSNKVMLKRGETLPGFILDLAPLATKKEHRQWLEAVTTAGMITWQVPPARESDRP